MLVKKLIFKIFYINRKIINIINISYKTLFGSKPLRIRFDEVFSSKNYDVIYNKLRCLISQKSVVNYVFAHNYAKIKIVSYHFLPRLILHIIILMHSIFNKD